VAKNFKILRDKMSPEARERSHLRFLALKEELERESEGPGRTNESKSTKVLAATAGNGASGRSSEGEG